jgi:hypothetical protein
MVYFAKLSVSETIRRSVVEEQIIMDLEGRCDGRVFLGRLRKTTKKSLILASIPAESQTGYIPAGR